MIGVRQGIGEAASVDIQDILGILRDETVAEDVALKCLCENGDSKWCRKCNARLSAVADYRQAVITEIERLRG
jgi:hypothetical protein